MAECVLTWSMLVLEDQTCMYDTFLEGGIAVMQVEC
jgi:hypothetical protein